MKRVKSRLLAGILSVAMAFSVVAVPIEALAATDTNGHWAESTINSWINSGYISGYPDGTFRPNNAISRAEFVTIANKAFGFTSSQGISFNDVKPGYWAYSEIQKGVAAGYIQGDTIGTFRPGSAVSRQEAAVMLANLRGYASDEGAAYNYTDRWAMANWATGAIGAVSRNGVMSGYPDGTFRPQQALTRAEAVASLQKIATSSNSFDTSVNNSNYTPPVYVTPSSNNSTYNNTTSNDDTFTGTILEGTRLENRTLTKDLLIPHSVGSQNITLKNIRMKGTLYIEGGNTITLDNCNIGTVVMNKSNAVLKNNGSSDVDEVRFEEKGRIDGKGYMNVLIDDDTVSEIIIDADIDTLILDADVDLKLYANANIDTFEITKNADTARIRIGEDAEVMEMEIYDKVRISGKGKIDTMTVYVSGVRSEIQPRRLIQQDNARKPNFNYKDDDDDDDDDYDNLTLDDDDEKFDGDDEKYNRVKIAAEDVTVKNLTAYDDLTITSAAGDSTIELEGVTVKGNVYIDGGGNNSVIFDNCSISGSIYSRKSTSGRYDEAVAIKLRDTSVRGDIYVTGDTILESDEKLNKVVLNKELSKTFRMDADADNLVINYNNDVQIRGSHTINAVEVVAGLTNVTITMNGGKFNTLTTRSPIKLEGTGTIDKLFTGQTNDISSGITIGSTEPIGGGTQPPSSNYVITSSISGTANGTITPLGQQTVAGGTTKEFNITANTGYHVASIVINGSQVNLDGKLYQTYKYTFYNVSSNHDIIVSFEAGAGTDGNGSASNGSSGGDVNAGDYKIEASINDPALGGCDNTSVTVKQGEDASITFKASEGSHVSKIVIDKGTNNEIDLKKISEGSKTYNEVTYVFKTVDNNHQIYAEFSKPVGSNDKITITSDMPNEADTSTSFRYNLETDVTYEDNGEVKSRDTDTQEKRYYCIAGETLKLSVPKFEVLNYSGDEEALKTKWIFSGVTQAIQAELTNGENGDAILETTAGSGYIVNVALQIYDTSQNDKVIVDRAAYKQIMVDVPVEGFTFAEADGNHTLTVKGNQISLTSQTFEYDPPEASSYFEQSEIIWTIDEEKTNIEEVTGQTSQKVRIEAKESNSSTKNYILFVEQKYKDETGIHTVAMPKGTVTVKATLPNGRGNLQDFTQDFTINFTNEIIPVTRLEFNPTELEKEGITTIDLPTTITTTIIPDQADNKTVEWRIVGYTAEDTKNCSSQDEFATIEKDTNKKDTKLSIKGYAGEVNLQAFIQNGIAMGTEYTTGETDVVVMVTSIMPQINARASLANETNNATVGKKVTLSARVENSDKTPYTKITGWEKSYDQNTWEPITTTPVSNSSPNSDGYYVSEYQIIEGDLNTNKYEGKSVYFRACVDYNDDIITKETNSIICKALEPTIQLTNTKTQYNQDVSGNVTSGYIVKGKDSITLCNEAGDGSTITWVAKSVPAELATLDASSYTLTTTGKEGSITLTATANADGGNISKDITLKIEPQYIQTLTISVLDTEGGSNVTSLPNDNKEKTVYLTAEFTPAFASFQEISWYKKDADLGTTENITANVATNGEYAFTPTKDVSFYAQIPFGKDGKVAAKSEEVNISLISPDTKIKVTGLDFEKLKPTLQVSENSPYSATLTVSNTSGVNISLDSVGYTQESGEPISGKLKYSIQGGSATLEGGLLTIPAKTQKLIIRFYIDDENYVDSGGTNKYEDTLTIDVTYNPTTKTGTTPSNSSANIQSPSAGEMSIDVINEDTVADENVITENTVENSVNENNTANTNTENQNNITAVTDIAFGDIRGLQAPIAPATTYNMTSSSSGNVVLYLADNTSTVNGITTHTGVKVLPENATYKNVTWKVKEGTLLAPSTVANVVNVTNIGSLNQNTNTFTVNANASGTVTLVATIANGKGQNNNFVKELTIRITPPNNASQSSVVPSDTTSSSTTSSNETSSSANMTKASARQVVSVGTTQVGTSSISSASGSQTSQSSTKNTTTSIINHSEVKIETSGQCRKNISIPLKAVSKTTQQEYTDVEWEIVDDGNTGAKISNKNRLRASKTGTVTVKATVYTPSNEKMECSTNIVISN